MQSIWKVNLTCDELFSTDLADCWKTIVGLDSMVIELNYVDFETFQNELMLLQYI